MSNWTSNLQYMTKFNPYVQQLPVQEMYTVGTELQRRYEEGVEKIQTAIDTVAGMDVVRDVDRQYLQGKLNHLGNNFKLFAGSDFSNYQLTRSLSGMVKQVGKDPDILNAVASTKVYRKGVEDMNSAIKEGKSAPSNEWDFKTQASKWLNSTDLKQSFNGGYSPYTDVKKHALEIIKGLTKSQSITEDAFTVDSKGNLVVADAVVRKELAGVPPEQIQQALIAGLSSADMKQLEVDGRYSYSNLGPEDLKNRLEQDKASQKASYTEKRKALESKRASANTAAEMSAIDDKIAQIDKTIAKVDKDYNSLLALDPETAKATLHTQNFFNGMGAAFSYTETSDTYKDSPFAKAEQWREEQSWDRKKFAAEYALKVKGLEIKEEALKLKKAKAAGESGGTEGSEWGGLQFSVDQKNVKEVPLKKVLDKIKDDETKLETDKIQILKETGLSEEGLNEAYKVYKETPSKVNAKLRGYFINREVAQRNVTVNNSVISEVTKMGEEKIKDVSKQILKDSPITVEVNGFPVTYSAKEIADFSTKFDKYTEIGATPTGTTIPSVFYKYKDDLAKEELSDRELGLYDIFKRQRIGMDKYGGNLSKEERELFKRSESYKTAYGDALKEKDKFIEEELKNRLAGHQGVDYTLNISKPYEKNEAQTFLRKIYDLATSIKGLQYTPKNKLNKDVLEKLALEPETFAVKVIEGTEFTEPIYEVTVSGTAGESSFFLSEEEKRNVWGNRFEASENVRALRPYQEQMRKMEGDTNSETGGTTTSMDKQKTNLKNAYLQQGIDFQGVKIFGINGNLTYNKDNKMYLYELNLYDPIKKKWTECVYYPSQYMTAEEVNKFKTQLNDAEIYRLLYDTDEPASDEQLKIIENYK